MFDNPGIAVYGAIAVAALLAAESPVRETYAKTVAAVVITLLLYWAAHSYGDLVEERLETGRRLSLGVIARAMRHSVSMLTGAAIPLLPIILWWITGGSLSGAVLAAEWTCAIMIVVIEVAAGIKGKLSGRELAWQISLGAMLGVMVMLLRVLLH
jgi:VIT1/CCC1 family predicted Fe2+/Mn2+ transporter